MSEKCFSLFSKSLNNTNVAIICVIKSSGGFSNTGRILINTKEHMKKHDKNRRYSPSRKRHYRIHAHARAKNRPTPIELFPWQEGCDMHHVNSNFTIPCFNFIHEQPHVCGDLLIDGWV